GQDALQAAVAIDDEDRIAGPGPADLREAVGEAGSRCDGHRLTPDDDLDSLVDQGRDTRHDSALGQVGHEGKCSHFGSESRRSAASTGTTRSPPDSLPRWI